MSSVLLCCLFKYLVYLIRFIIYFKQFSSLFRCRDRASADGNLHSSPGGDGQRCSRHFVLHEPRRARSNTFTVGSFKSISGNFNLIYIGFDMSL